MRSENFRARREAWASDTARAGGMVLYVAGAGTTRAVAVFRRLGADVVVTGTIVTAADMAADDWELIT